MIRVEEVSKRFGRVQALDSVTATVDKGSIYGLVGTNGSGKTTLLRHMSGVYMSDSGIITIDEESVFENVSAKQKLCFIADEPYFHAKDTLDSLAAFHGGLYMNWSQDAFIKLTDAFGLDRKTKISTFSKGNQKRAAFCLAMASQPEYLLLDEPLDGLDPLARRLFWDSILDAVSEKDMSVIISSHNLRELEDYCDTVGILSNGHMLLELDIDELKEKSCKVQAAYANRSDNPYSGLHVLNLESSGNADLLVVRNTAEEVENALREHDPVILNITPLSLEEIFIYEIGGAGDECKDII